MASRKKSAATAPTVEAFKGFSKDLTCRDFQYEIGATYKHDGAVERCAAGFHSCDMPLDVWNYYEPTTSRYAKVEIGGAIDRATDGDTKIASAEITVRAELKLPKIVRAAAAWIVERAKGNIGKGTSGHAAATGDRGHAAATGTSGHAAATGNGGHAAATGYRSHAAATGDRGHAAATGYRSHAAATGNGGHAAATGDRSHAAATGNGGHAAATGNGGHAAATGNGGHAAATGDRGHAAVKGKNAIAASLGIYATAQAAEGGWIVLAAYDDDYELVVVRTAKVGAEGVKPGVRYRLTTAGEFEAA